jgi:hypothetical protein
MLRSPPLARLITTTLQTRRERPILKPIVKSVTKIIHFHGMCTFTEDYNVDLGLYGMIRKSVPAGFCVRGMWCYYSSFVPRAVSPDRRPSAAQIKRAKEHWWRVRRNPLLYVQSPYCTSFRIRSINVQSIIVEVVVKRRQFTWTLTKCCSNSPTNARCCRHSDMSFWWWVEITPETCRAVYRYK